jgi:hypothetical protein
MGGAAFDGGDNSVDEVVRILQIVADGLNFRGAVGVPDSDPIVDINGNTVGSWGVTLDPATLEAKRAALVAS